MEQFFDETELGNSFNGDDETFKSTSKSANKPERSFSSGFDCNICLDSVQDPVVTLCGHLYCWPCIYKWIHHQNTPSEETLEKKTPKCPVCKTEISQKTIVPLYGRGQASVNEEKSPSLEELAIPPRPPTPRYGAVGEPAGPLLSRRGFHQRAPPPLSMPDRGGVDLATVVMSPSPTIGMLGEMVSGRILGDLETPLFATPNSYNLAGVSTRRARRQATEADRLLSRIYTFLFCCLILFDHSEPYISRMAMQTTPQNTINGDHDKSMAKGTIDESETSVVTGNFECNICLDSVQDPVVTLCGHLYCWPCIYKWIQHQNTSSSETLENQKAQCPICKSEVSQKTIVPLYGPLGQTTNIGVGSVIPPRPPTSGYQQLAMPAQQRSRLGYRQHAPPPLAMPAGSGGGGMTVVVPSPTIGMLGEMVCGRILGELGSPLFGTPNSYNISGMSTRRERWHTTQVDKSLSRIYIFLFCGVILSLLLFT
ncbi:hypothetical protein OSB04_014287 [Centaurea solstitialis]|uniref:E3 ubiquitin-protein ligase RMA n=1 Tax=Centaurea solstitialis TaxID=347529 RepID=A0AA38TF50_9ASTR|nr:hypothetical protein OSB04_014287 [Centaurea solstitialis]